MMGVLGCMVGGTGPAMKLLGVAVASVVICVTTTALVAEAGGRRGHVRGHVHGSRHFDRHHHHHGHHGLRHHGHHGFRHHGHHGHHGFKHRSVLPLFVGPSVVLAAPFATPSPVYAPPVYTAPPVYAPPTYAIPGPPAMPRVVEFPTGRYELRGDGVYSPYTWVWIPNPPAAPPPPPPAEAPAPPAATDPAPRATAARTALLYRWTDEQGVTTWTDSVEKVPARYRAQAIRLAP
jgi:hypothetical protein